MTSSSDSVSDSAAPRIYSRNEHPISRQGIDPDALKILYRLIRHGFRAYLVGGGVRDLLLRKQPKDFDIATDATPREIKGLFRNSRIIGRRFRLIHVFFHGGKNIEVATFRAAEEPIDPEDAAEHEPQQNDENIFGTEGTDARRRDLTINGLFYDLATFSVIDYVGGYEDLKAGLIRIIGDPDTRFHEDPVRLMRVVRHAARADFTIEQSCRESLRRNAHILAQSSAVRVFVELSKDLCSGSVLSILRLLEDTGLLAPLLPRLAERAQLLGQASGLSQALFRFDQSIREGATPTVTPVLALLLLYAESAAEQADDLFKQWDDHQHLEETVLNGFPSLAVPRKERERIGKLLDSWFDLREPKDLDARVRAFSRRNYFGELKEFCGYLYGQGHPVVEAFATVKAQPRQSRGRRSSGPGRSGGRNRAPRRNDRS